MAGLKIRVPDAPLYMMFPKAVGANPDAHRIRRGLSGTAAGRRGRTGKPAPTIEAKKFYEVQDHIVLTGHITDALLTIVAGSTWDNMSEEDRAILTEVAAEAAAQATQEIIQKEKDLVQTFRDRGKDVIEVDRAPFRAAVVEQHMSADATWDQEVYDRLQALQ
jgi:TRAP-type C4-dicarboxylate transport system substrate-binding protein